MEGIYIMMPIKVMNNHCTSCQDLDIDTDCFPVIEEDRMKVIQNLKCRNLNKCCRIRDQIMREAEGKKHE